MKRKYEVDEVVKFRFRNQFYDVKIIDADSSQGYNQYKIHFVGWHSRHDQWALENDLRPKVALPRPFAKLAPRGREESMQISSRGLSPSLFPAHPSPCPSSIGDSPSSSQSPQYRGARIDWTMRRTEPFHSPSSVSTGPDISNSLPSKEDIVSPMSQELISQMASSRIGSRIHTKEKGISVQNHENTRHYPTAISNDHQGEKDGDNSLMKRKHQGHDEAHNKRKVVELVVGKNSSEKKQQEQPHVQTGGENRRDEERGPQSHQTSAEELSPMQLITPNEGRKQLNGKTSDKLSPKISELEYTPPQASSSSKSPEMGVTRKEYRKETDSISSLEDPNVPRDIEVNTELEGKSVLANGEFQMNAARRMEREEAVSPTTAMISLADEFYMSQSQAGNSNELPLFQELQHVDKNYGNRTNEPFLFLHDNQGRVINEVFDDFALVNEESQNSQPQTSQGSKTWHELRPMGFNSDSRTPQTSHGINVMADNSQHQRPVMVDENGDQLSGMSRMLCSSYSQTQYEPITELSSDFKYLPMELNQAPAGMLLEELVMDGMNSMEPMNPMDLMDPMNPMDGMTPQPQAINRTPMEYSQPQGQTIQVTLPPGVHPSQVSLGPGMRMVAGPQRSYVLSDPSMAPLPAPVQVMRQYVSVANSVSTTQQTRIISQEDHNYGLISRNGSGASRFSRVIREEDSVRPAYIRPAAPPATQPSVAPLPQTTTPVSQEIDGFYQAPLGHILIMRSYKPRSWLSTRPNPTIYQQINEAGGDTYYEKTYRVENVNGSLPISSPVASSPHFSTPIQPSFGNTRERVFIVDYRTPGFETTAASVNHRQQTHHQVHQQSYQSYHQSHQKYQQESHHQFHQRPEMSNQKMVPGPSNRTPAGPSGISKVPMVRPSTAPSVPPNLMNK